MPLPSFCPHCGGPIAPKPISPEEPCIGVCSSCGREVYANSRPAAGVFLVRGDEVLLVRRGREPALGKWDIPGGFLNEGELPEDGARREIQEELGWDVGALRFVLFGVNPQPGGAVLDILFEAEAPDDDPRPMSDVADCEWFAIDRLPEDDDLAFAATRDALHRWRDGK